MKHCPSCKQDLDKSLFWGDARRKDGLGVYCKNCERAKRIKRESSPKAKEAKRERSKLAMRKIRSDPAKAEALRKRTREYRAMHRGAFNGVTKEDLAKLLADHNGCCAYCGKSDGRISFDHVQPLSKGGQHSIDNLKPCCRSCNCKKKDKTLDEFLSYLSDLKDIFFRLQSLQALTNLGGE